MELCNRYAKYFTLCKIMRRMKLAQWSPTSLLWHGDHIIKHSSEYTALHLLLWHVDHLCRPLQGSNTGPSYKTQMTPPPPSLGTTITILTLKGCGVSIYGHMHNLYGLHEVSKPFSYIYMFDILLYTLSCVKEKEKLF